MSRSLFPSTLIPEVEKDIINKPSHVHERFLNIYYCFFFFCPSAHIFCCIHLQGYQNEVETGFTVFIFILFFQTSRFHNIVIIISQQTQYLYCIFVAALGRE